MTDATLSVKDGQITVTFSLAALNLILKKLPATDVKAKAIRAYFATLAFVEVDYKLNEGGVAKCIELAEGLFAEIANSDPSMKEFLEWKKAQDK